MAKGIAYVILRMWHAVDMRSMVMANLKPKWNF
jgi:hypothetical protein